MPELYDKFIIVGPDGEAADVVAGALQTSGGGGGGGAVTVADGADVTQGAIADAAVAAGAAGTVSAKLRTVTTLLNGGLPAALGAGGGLKVEFAAGGVGFTVLGNVASGSADSGFPVKVGGKYNSTLPTFADGQRGDLQITSKGLLRIQIEQGTNVIGVANPSTGNGADIGLITASRPSSYNGATWDANRGNEPATLLASAARTATTSSADQTNYNGKGVLLVVNVTAEAGTTTLTLTVQGKDSISGNYYDLITGIVVYNAATDTPTVTRAIAIYPGVLTADAIGAGNANLISQKSVVLPRTWRVTVTPSDASSQTYSVSGVTLL